MKYKIVLIVAGGRTGSDFLQSLFDSHEEILQLPGIFKYLDFWNKIKKLKNYEEIGKFFINNHKFYFDSKLNLVERHNTLGKSKKDYFQVNENSFLNYLKKNHVNEIKFIEVLTNIHLAYDHASKKNLNSKKIIILHLHHINQLSAFKKYDCSILYTIRDPLSNIQSAIYNNWKFRKYNYGALSLWFQYDKILNGLNDVLNMNIETYVVKLENLHLKNEIVMQDICDKFGIRFLDTLTQSTYHGKLWWGDQISAKDLNGINKNFNNRFCEKNFFKNDITILQKILLQFIKYYNYPVRTVNKKYFIFLPMKVELLLFFYFTKAFVKTRKIIFFKKILQIFFYYFLRIKSLKRYKLINKFPYSFGDF